MFWKTSDADTAAGGEGHVEGADILTGLVDQGRCSLFALLQVSARCQQDELVTAMTNQ